MALPFTVTCARCEDSQTYPARIPRQDLPYYLASDGWQQGPGGTWRCRAHTSKDPRRVAGRIAILLTALLVLICLLNFNNLAAIFTAIIPGS